MSMTPLSGLRGLHRMPDQLASTLASSGVSADTASKVKSEIENLPQAARKSAAQGLPPAPEVMRAAIDEQLARDVQAGALSQGDADKIVAALDRFEASIQSGFLARGAGGPPPGGGGPGGPGGPPPGGGPGGGPGGPSPGGGSGGGPGSPPPMGEAGGAPRASASAEAAKSALDQLLEALEELKSDSADDDASSVGTASSTTSKSKSELAAYLGALLDSAKVDISA